MWRIFKSENEYGYTVLELLLVITIFTLFSMMVISILTLKGHRIDEGETYLKGWLLQQQQTAQYQSAPIRLCVFPTSIVVQRWNEWQWEQTEERFIVPRNQMLSVIYDKPNVSVLNNNNSHNCFMINGNSLQPSGQIIISDNNHKSVIEWHEQ